MGKRKSFKVLQIIPAAGWRAVFAERPEKPGDPSFRMRPLVCWALSDCDEGYHIDGLSTDGVEVEPAPMSDGFVCYLAPGQDTDGMEERAKELLDELDARLGT